MYQCGGGDAIGGLVSQTEMPTAKITITAYVETVLFDTVASRPKLQCIVTFKNYKNSPI